MQYLYHPEASRPQLRLSGDSHRYLFRVRRHKTGETLYLRNLEDETLYGYTISYMDKKEASLVLVSQEKREIRAQKRLHIGWCMIDPKSIEKALPMLNEAGVEAITFIYCERSQTSFKTDFKRWRKILLNSSQQCGRSVMMKLEQAPDLATFVARYPETYLLDFSPLRLTSGAEIETIVIGCEGGMRAAERTLFPAARTVGLNTPMILRSESAAVAAANLLLL